MAHLPNKLRKEQRDEADRQRRLHSGSATDRTPPPALKCDACGREGGDQWKPGGEFIRFFAMSPTDRWGTGKIYCEFCLEPQTGIKPNEHT